MNLSAKQKPKQFKTQRAGWSPDQRLQSLQINGDYKEITNSGLKKQK
jgi:hypothetical protein